MNSPALEASPLQHRPARPRTRVLLVTTKSPWPATDGGRLLVAETLRALDPQQVDVTLAGPWRSDADAQQLLLDTFPVVSRVVAAPAPQGGLSKLARRALFAVQCTRSLITTRAAPVTAIKHLHLALRAQLEELLNTTSFDVVHVEQPHAMGPLPDTNVPIILRAQNVEAHLWRRYAAALPRPQRWLVRRQAQAVANWERAAAQRARLVLAISEEDRLGFEQLGVSPERLQWLPPAVPRRLAPVIAPKTTLPGAPSVVLFGGASWKPNQLGEQDFVNTAWPAISERFPDAVLHAFGHRDRQPRSSIQYHRAPDDSGQALQAGSILIVPATVTSGVRMKILEAFARGLCVVTTQAGARGLGAQALQAVAVAQTPEQWVDAVAELLTVEARRKRAALGRLALSVNHDPSQVGSLLQGYYNAAGNSS